MWFLLACVEAPACGTGTHDEDGVCVADTSEEDTGVDSGGDTDTDGDPDSDPDSGDDTGVDSDTGVDTDTGVDSDTGEETGDSDVQVDEDGDGYGVDDDCDHDDPAVHPGATEVCGNHADDDCDGTAGACAWSGHYDVADVGVALTGEFGGDGTGREVAGGGDLDGDGYDDVAIGAPWADEGESGSGTVYVVGGPTTSATSLARSATARIDGEDGNAYLGTVLSIPGDLDGDGADDLLVSAPPGNCSRDGDVYLFRGPITGSLGPDDAARHWIGGNGWDGLGQSVSGVGDVSGDGTPDFVVGARCSGASTYSAAPFYLFTGDDAASGDAADEAAGELRSTYNSVGTGRQVAAAGDVDGDGLADLLLGAGSGEGVHGVAVVPGPISGNLYIEDAADAVITGGSISWEAPHMVAGGDVNADGYSDVLMGAIGGTYTDPGHVYLFQGPLSGNVDVFFAEADISGSGDSSMFGYTVAAPGDITGDGTGDLLLSASEDDRYGSNAGAAYLVPGPVSGSQDVDDVTSAAFHGSDVSAGLTVGLGAGDLNADGLLDLVLGSYYTDGDAPTAGSAFLLYGNGS